jgi:Icc-related predicted phosphoesterase
LEDEGAPIRIAAFADVHCYDEVRERLRYEIEPVNERADALVLAGDLTFVGKVDEAKHLADVLRHVRVPVVAVLGNHDYEMDRDGTIAEVLRDAGVQMLDGGTHVVECRGQRVGFAGVKGFCGGFGQRLVAPFGEAALKAFVRVGQVEAEKLDAGLENLRRGNSIDHVVAVTHYAPISETVIGEPPEIWPFLGSSSLCVPIDRHQVDVVFHGHAHYGTPVGHTPAGILVYNVARPLVRSLVIHELVSDREKILV